MTETPIGAPTTEEEGLEAEKEQTAALFSNMARIFGLVSGGLFVLIVLACQGARCAGKAGFLGRVGVVDHFGVLYSTFDWAMDLFSAAEMYDAGGTNYAKTALTVCGIHVAANAVAFGDTCGTPTPPRAVPAAPGGSTRPREGMPRQGTASEV